MKSYFITLLSLIFIFINISKSQSCTVSDGLYQYDFSPLNGTFYIRDNRNYYYISICNISTTCSYYFPDSAACQYASYGVWYDIGNLTNYNLTSLDYGQGGRIVYTGSSSSDCPTNSTTIINMYCSTSSTHLNSFYEYPTCTYNFNVYSNLACPTIKPTETPTSSPNITTTPFPTPSPTVTTTPFPNNNGSVTTSTTTTSPDDDTTITQTITQRYSEFNYLISVTNTTTITNYEGTNTITETSIYENDGDIRVTKTSTYTQRSIVTTNTFN